MAFPCVSRIKLNITLHRKFSALYKEYHNEIKGVNVLPPTASEYLLRLYPTTIERDALLEAAEVNYQYKYVKTQSLHIRRLFLILS